MTTEERLAKVERELTERKEAEAMDTLVKFVGACVLAAALAVGFLAPFARAQAESPRVPEAAAEEAADRPAPPAENAAESIEAPLGPVYVRPFEPMTVTLLGLKEFHTPVYFRSPLATPSPTDASVDRCLPLAAGAAVADWLMFTGRALAFPIEMILCPPWTKVPLAD